MWCLQEGSWWRHCNSSLSFLRLHYIMLHTVRYVYWIHSKLDPFELKSWRPIANVTFISKLIERLAIRRFNEHSTEHHLLPMNQSAYRAHHSTETAVTTVVDDIARAVDSGEDVCSCVARLVSSLRYRRSRDTIGSAAQTLRSRG